VRIEHLLHKVLTETTLVQPIMLLLLSALVHLYLGDVDHNMILFITESSMTFSVSHMSHVLSQFVTCMTITCDIMLVPLFKFKI